MYFWVDIHTTFYTVKFSVRRVEILSNLNDGVLYKSLKKQAEDRDTS